jgi:hypothetical protein
MGNLHAMLEGYFELCFIMTKVGSFDENLGDRFELSSIIVVVGNLDTNLVGYFMYFS